MKIIIKRILQYLLGYKNYLYIFARYIIATIKWNSKEGDFLHFIKLMPPKGIILDLGANIGVMSALLCKKLPQSRVIAFEPVPSNIVTLRKIIKHYKLSNIKICEYALGDYNGEVEMILPVNKNVKMQGLSHVKHSSIAENNDGIIYKVKVNRLDDIDELFSTKETVTGIKIDVENFEYFVLKGGENLIKKYMPIIYCELWNNENRTNCFTFLKNLNYSIKVLENNKLVNFENEVHTTQNFFFIPKEK